MVKPTNAEIAKDLHIFGRNLYAARERIAPDQLAFARLVDVDRSTISKIECGKQAPKFDTFLALALTARLKPAELLRGVGLLHVPPETPSHAEITATTPAELFGANLK